MKYFLRLVLRSLPVAAALIASAQTPDTGPSSPATSLNPGPQGRPGSVSAQVSALASHCVFVGDSLTSGYKASPGFDYPSQAMSLPWFTNCTKSNLGVPGWTIENITGDYTRHAHPLSPAVTGQVGYLFVMIGANNIGVDRKPVAADFQALVSYWNTAIADGWRLVALTVTPNMVTDPTYIEQFDDLIRSSTIPWRIVDTYTAFGDPYNTTYYTPDQEHFNDAGYKAIAEAVNNQLMTGTPINKAAGLHGVGVGLGNTRGNFTTLGKATTAGGDTALGYQAMFNTTTGSNDTSVGMGSLYSNTTGSYNSAFGFRGLFLNSTGADNSALGYLAGGYSNGSHNSFLGYEAGEDVVYSFSGKTIAGSPSITTSSTSRLVVGQTLQGASIPASATITAIAGNASVTMSSNASATQGPYTIYASSNPLVSGDNDTYLGANANVGSTAQPKYQTVVGAGAGGNGSNSVTLGRAVDVVYAPGGIIAPGIQLAIPAGSQPACDAANEGYLRYIKGSSNSGGALQVCQNQSGKYTWVTH
jgi:lysophospholipase L1-like esterase